jgi:hypothetical protein
MVPEESNTIATQSIDTEDVGRRPLTVIVRFVLVP